MVAFAGASPAEGQEWAKRVGQALNDIKYQRNLFGLSIDQLMAAQSDRCVSICILFVQHLRAYIY